MASVARRRLKPVSHEDRLTLVDHLGELRSRLMVAGGAVAVAFAVCAWQNHFILEIVNRPLPDNVPEPITFGVTEPFTTTLTNAGYFAMLIALPVILYQVYAFILPAFSPSERRVATPLALAVPVLFIAGVLFCYFVVLTPATKFLLNFNSSEFNTQVRAKDYYSFVLMTLLAMGIAFQVPMGLLAVVRVGLTTPEKLRKNRRYAILVIAVLAAFLPTVDPVSLLLEIVPMLLLYEAGIILAATIGSPKKAVEADPPSTEDGD